MKKILKSRVLPIVMLFVLVITSCISSVVFVNAKSSIKKSSVLWSGVNNKIEASKEEYPFSGVTYANAHMKYEDVVKHVSLDMLYGITKGLVTYHGELPFEETHDKDGKVLDGWAGYYSIDGTFLSDNNSGTNPNFDIIPASVDAKTYWGTGAKDAAGLNGNDNFNGKAGVESINKNGVTSLRIYALEATPGGGAIASIGSFFGNLAYNIARGGAWLATMFVKLIVQAKNLDMELILDVLHMNDLGELVTKNFIGDPGGIGLSPFTAFCIIMCIFAIVGFAINYVRGGQKENGIINIVLTVFLGLVVIGVSLLGKWEDLGGTMANAASKVMYTVTQSLSTGNNGDAFKIDINDSKNSTYETQLSELSMIYKPYIDAQICTQFGVSNIDTLNVKSLGGDTSLLARGYSDKEFNSNLGYYFWFANSSANYHDSQHVPNVNAGVAEDKLSSMITYLQTAYDSGSNKTTILGIVDAFADPHTIMGMVLMLGLTAVMILLGIVLIKYAINILIAKLEVFVALLGLTIAGPLIITNNKKLVDTGKFILGMLLVSIIEITIWGVFFDLILYTVAVILDATIPRILVTIAFLLLFWKFNPLISEKIKQVLDNSTRAISPAFQTGRNAIKQQLRRKANELASNIDNSDKFAGYDAEGNEIRKTRAGGLASRMAHLAANSLEDSYNRKSLYKITKDANVDAAKANNATNKQIRESATRVREGVENDIAAEAQNTEAQINAEREQVLNKAAIRDEAGNIVGYNTDGLTDEEKALIANYETLKAEEAELVNSKEYKMLKAEQAKIAQANNGVPEDERVSMSQDKLDRLNELENQIAEKQALMEEQRIEIASTIRDRATTDAARARKISIDQQEGESVEDAIKRATKLAAQQNHATEYEAALTDEMNAHALDANNLTNESGKIGTHKTKINKSAVTAQTEAAIRLAQLREGQIVDEKTAKKQAAAIADHIEETNKTLSGTISETASKITHHGADGRDTTVENAKEKYKNARLFSKERAQAKADYKELVEAKKSADDAYADQTDLAKEVTKIESGAAIHGTTSVSERINALVKNREALDIQTKDEIKNNAVAETRAKQTDLKNRTVENLEHSDEIIHGGANAATTAKDVIANQEKAAAANQSQSGKKSINTNANTNTTDAQTTGTDTQADTPAATQTATQTQNASQPQPQPQNAPQPQPQPQRKSTSTQQPGSKINNNDAVVNESDTTSTPQPAQTYTKQTTAQQTAQSTTESDVIPTAETATNNSNTGKPITGKSSVVNNESTVEPIAQQAPQNANNAAKTAATAAAAATIGATASKIINDQTAAYKNNQTVNQQPTNATASTSTGTGTGTGTPTSVNSEVPTNNATKYTQQSNDNKKTNATAQPTASQINTPQNQSKYAQQTADESLVVNQQNNAQPASTGQPAQTGKVVNTGAPVNQKVSNNQNVVENKTQPKQQTAQQPVGVNNSDTIRQTVENVTATAAATAATATSTTPENNVKNPKATQYTSAQPESAQPTKQTTPQNAAQPTKQNATTYAQQSPVPEASVNNATANATAKTNTNIPRNDSYKAPQSTVQSAAQTPVQEAPTNNQPRTKSTDQPQQKVEQPTQAKSVQETAKQVIENKTKASVNKTTIDTPTNTPTNNNNANTGNSQTAATQPKVNTSIPADTNAAKPAEHSNQVNQAEVDRMVNESMKKQGYTGQSTTEIPTSKTNTNASTPIVDKDRSTTSHVESPKSTTAKPAQPVQPEPVVQPKAKSTVNNNSGTSAVVNDAINNATKKNSNKQPDAQKSTPIQPDNTSNTSSTQSPAPQPTQKPVNKTPVNADPTPQQPTKQPVQQPAQQPAKQPAPAPAPQNNKQPIPTPQQTQQTNKQPAPQPTQQPAPAPQQTAQQPVKPQTQQSTQQPAPAPSAKQPQPTGSPIQPDQSTKQPSNQQSQSSQNRTESDRQPVNPASSNNTKSSNDSATKSTTNNPSSTNNTSSNTSSSSQSNSTEYVAPAIKLNRTGRKAVGTVANEQAKADQARDAINRATQQKANAEQTLRDVESRKASRGETTTSTAFAQEAMTSGKSSKQSKTDDAVAKAIAKSRLKTATRELKNAQKAEQKATKQAEKAQTKVDKSRQQAVKGVMNGFEQQKAAIERQRASANVVTDEMAAQFDADIARIEADAAKAAAAYRTSDVTTSKFERNTEPDDTTTTTTSSTAAMDNDMLNDIENLFNDEG